MYRRNTINTKPNEYPEHLNPFHDGMEDADVAPAKSKLGRRNSRLTASLRLKSWNVFSSKKHTKASEADVTITPNTSKGKFSTLSPQLSQRILDALSPRSKKKQETTPITRNSTDKAGTLREPEFRITPRQGSKPSAAGDADRRDRDANKTNDEHRSTIRLMQEQRDSCPRLEIVEDGEEISRKPVPEPRVVLTPVPLPRSLTRGQAAKTTEEMLHRNQEVSSSSRYPIEEVKFIKQGAKPKKKRQAPLPPSTPSSSQKEINSNTSETNSTGSSESPSPKPAPRPRIECSPSSIEEEMEDGITAMV